MDQETHTMKNILISIRPEYANQIMDGCKTVELRRRFTKEINTKTRLFIYSSGPVGAIVGSVRIDKVTELPVKQIWKQFGQAACIEKTDFENYFDGIKFGLALSLGKVTALDEVVDKEDMLDRWGIRPPQSYMYLSAEIASAISRDAHEISARHKRDTRHRRPSTG